MVNLTQQFYRIHLTIARFEIQKTIFTRRRTRLKIETMKDFYLTLLSNSSLHMYPDNKQNSFTVKLDHPIQIEKELCEVVLVEIITSSQILNISEENNFYFLRFYDRNLAAKIDDVKCTYDGSCAEIDFKIPKGNYHSPFHLIEEIQNIIDRRYGTMLKQNNASISITYGKIVNA